MSVVQTPVLTLNMFNVIDTALQRTNSSCSPEDICGMDVELLSAFLIREFFKRTTFTKVDNLVTSDLTTVSVAAYFSEGYNWRKQICVGRTLIARYLQKSTSSAEWIHRYCENLKFSWLKEMYSLMALHPYTNGNDLYCLLFPEKINTAIVLTFTVLNNRRNSLWAQSTQL